MRDLGKLADAAECEATALSTDGSTVVGWSELNIGTTTTAPLVWRGSGPLRVLSLDGVHAGRGAKATGVSGDGRIIVGWASDPDPTYARTAIQWIDGTPHQLPLVGDYLNNTALWITSDARMIVGGVSGSSSGLPSHSYIWFAGGGGIPLYDYWAQNGVQMPVGWAVSALNAMSPDGNTFVGEMKQGTNGPTYGFVVTVPAPATSLIGMAFAFAVRRRRSRSR
ncbi:MAG: hypothetical protein JSR77_14870 [Planctomycetes bacterium]|nr:hypothetical protein [Planctomycetota bacterium]